MLLFHKNIPFCTQDAMEYHEEYTEDFARDFLDVYLNEIKKQQPDSSFNSISDFIIVFVNRAKPFSSFL